MKKYDKIAPNLADCIKVNLPQSFSFFEFLQEHWRRIKASNCLEPVSEEVKRQTRVLRVSPNEDSCLGLVSAVLFEIKEDWEFGRVYLQFDPH